MRVNSNMSRNSGSDQESRNKHPGQSSHNLVSGLTMGSKKQLNLKPSSDVQPSNQLVRKQTLLG